MVPLIPLAPHRRGSWVAVGSALRFCLEPRHLRRSLVTAAVVGAVLTLINHGDLLLQGEVMGGTWVKICLNFVVPFVVTNVGMLAGRPKDEPRERFEGGSP